MAEIKTYRDLVVWQKAISVVTQLYVVTQEFPPSEVYGITSQMRRAAISIPSNIADGYARNSDGDFIRFLRISCGSVYELQTQVEIAANLQYLAPSASEQLRQSLSEIERMLASLINKISSRANAL